MTETITTFESLALNERIQKAVTLCGYPHATDIQAQSIPHILAGRDIVAAAQTGTGKTAAFVLPALNRLCENKSKGKARILILSPTRELATQITDAVARYSKFMQVNIVSILGGMPYHKQLKELSRQVDIIVATPGRLMDHMERKRVDLSGIEMLILDEADRMLDMGFIDDVNFIAKNIPNDRQTLLFSATVDRRLSQIIRGLLNDPITIDIATANLTPDKIKQILYYTDDMNHKMKLLEHLLENENMFKAIIFSATKANADMLADELTDRDYPAAALHGDLKQNQRNKTVDRLRRGKIQFLVATDVAARGIDISDITHVINFDLPKFSEDYVHRIGRTGRAGKTGIAISFASPSDIRNVQKIEHYIGQHIPAEVIAGLEPKKRQGGSAAHKGKKKSSGGKPSYAGNRDGKRFAKPYSDKPARGRSDNASSSFKSDRKKFDDKPSAERAERSRFSDSARSSRPSEGKRFSDSPRADRSSSERSRFSDSARSSRPSEGKRFSDSPRSDRSSSERSSFSDSPRSDRSSPERSRFSDSARSSRPSEGKRFSDSARTSRPSEGKRFSDSPRSDRAPSERSRFSDSARSSRPSEGKRFSDSPRSDRAPSERSRFSDSARSSRPSEGKRFSDSPRSDRSSPERSRFSDSARSSKPSEGKRFSDSPRSSRPSEGKRFSDSPRSSRPSEGKRFSDSPRSSKPSEGKRFSVRAKPAGTASTKRRFSEDRK